MAVFEGQSFSLEANLLPTRQHHSAFCCL